MEHKKRIESIDTIRGMAVILMIIYHFLYDVVYFLGLPAWVFNNPAFTLLQPLIAGAFITVAGVSSRYSRSNVKRGCIVLICAVATSVATWLVETPVRFGILHFMGTCMVLYGLTHKLWEKLPEKAAPFLYILLFLITGQLLTLINPVKIPYLFPFGLLTDSFYSSDYFPIFPWCFVFLFGAWLGGPIRAGKLPDRFYTWGLAPFAAIGRKALILYILHQPVLYGITMALKAVL